MKYLLIAFAFLACTNVSKKSGADGTGPKFSTEPLDTIKSSPALSGVRPALLETAFITGTTEKINEATLNLYGITIGNLKVVSGHIIACDPLHIDEYGKPYTQMFPTGEFPVQLSIAKLQDAETTAFARIKFSDEPVVRWEFALLEGQSPIPVGGDDSHGYSVDNATGIFIDEEASKALDKKQVLETDGAVWTQMEKHYRNDWKYNLYEFGKYNLATFSTGLGDGRFSTYIGFDAAGKPCRLVTDFGLFDWNIK